MKRKGRPRLGRKREYRCNDSEYAALQLAALLKGCKIAELVREAATHNADEIIREHLETLRSLELTDEMMKQVAAEYLADQENRSAKKR